MKIYYPHFIYNTQADDAYFYGGFDGRKFLKLEDACKEAIRIMQSCSAWGALQLPPDANNITGYRICEEEVF